MIDITFLTSSQRFNLRSGMEYIDYQNKDFFNTLTGFIETILDPITLVFDWSRDNREKLQQIIKEYTRISVSPMVIPMENFAIEAGFISPNSVLNLEDVEQFIKKEGSNIGTFFKEFKKKALVGWCDLKTGKVCGDFEKVNFTLFLPEMMFIKKKEIEQVIKSNKGSLSSIVAAGIIHECGHAFFALHTVSQSSLEDIFLTKAAVEISKTKNTAEKVKIVAALKKETDIDVSREVTETGQLTIIGFNEGMAIRDYKRTLSLETARITPEVLANAYAVRMGAGLSIAAIFSVLEKRNRKLNRLSFAEIGIINGISAALSINPIFGIVLLLIRIGTRLDNQLVSQEHETYYRTIKSALRDMIDTLRTARTKGDAKVIAELTADALEMDKMAEKAKPLLEDTVVQRMLSALVDGRKEAKRATLEHYTAELNYNPLSLYTQLK